MRREPDFVSSPQDLAPKRKLAPIDFKQAEFESEQPQIAACQFCNENPSEAYYTCNQNLVCESCEQTHRDSTAPGSAPGRLLAATTIGSLAAVVASALWLLITRVTGYEFGLISILVGWIVGAAVRGGSEGIGGWPYQTLAVGLTYSAIVLTYVPEIAAGIEAENGANLLNYVIAVPLSFAIPFLGFTENLVGVFIIGLGLHQAWNMTKKTRLVWEGPFQIASPTEFAKAA